VIKKADLVLTERCNLNCVHCQSRDARITTSTGIKEIKDVEVGDEVLTLSGKFAKVEKIFSHHQSPAILSIKPHHLPSGKMTSNHEVLVMEGGLTTKIEAGKLTLNHYLIAPKSKKNKLNELKQSEFSTEFENYWAIKVQELKSVPYSGEVFNLQVDDPNHSYVANGIAVGNCFMYDAGNNRTIREPSQKQVLDTFETLASNGITKLNMWGGEVHLRQDFYEILKVALDMFSQVSIQTHGAIETYLGFIHKDYPTLGVHVSLEGWGKDDEVIRGRGHFLRAKRNIEILAQQLGEALTIRTTIFNGNNVIPLIQVALDLGCSWVGVRFKPVGRGQKLLKLQPSQERLADLYRLVASIRKSHKNILLEETPFYLYDEYLSQKYQNYFLRKGFACEWGRRIVVDVDGRAFPCPYAMTDSLGLGSILEDDFKVIEENYRTLIKQRQNTELISQCNICPLRDACFGGCSIYSLFNEDKRLGDPLCPIPSLLSGNGSQKQK